MALGSQATRTEAMSALTGLTHDIFVGKVARNVIRESKVGQLFSEALPGGDYRLEGQNMVFATDLRYATGAMATSGKVPDHVGLDAVQGKITPVRRYRRIALDNLVEKRASGPGAFDNLSDRIFDILWDSWKSMEIRHAIGDTSGVLCGVSARTSNTVWTATAGYNSSGTNPLSHISEGSIIGWYDTSAAAVGGAGVVSSINYTTGAVTMAASWEQGGNAIAAGDFVYFATTSSTTADYF